MAVEGIVVDDLIVGLDLDAQPVRLMMICASGRFSLIYCFNRSRCRN
jgi:hypothetical protein